MIGAGPPRLARLARPLSALGARYDVVVVGSGYGGSVAACRLARAGRAVCLLERGRELHPGEYPNTVAEGVRELQVHSLDDAVGEPTALFDVRVGPDIDVLVGCGLGGTSLINASVALRPEPRIFDDPRWPDPLRHGDDDLEAGFRRAEEMLAPTPYPRHAPPLAKLAALEQSAAALGRTAVRVPLSITFDVGGPGAPCTGCGDCCSGCNYGAKNTTAMTYLPDAVAHGAAIFCEVGVRRVEQAGGGWRVIYRDLRPGPRRMGEPERWVEADVVVLAAGTLGSTEILLRSRQAGLAVSAQLGRRFSGNGDVVAWAYAADQAVHGVGAGHRAPDDEHPVGPCITAMIDLRGRPRLEDGLIIEEGVIPGLLAPFLPTAFAAVAATQARTGGEGRSEPWWQRLVTAAGAVGDGLEDRVTRTQTYLVMSSDDDEGRVELEDDRPVVRWPGVGERPVVTRDNDDLRAAAAAIGATYLHDPLWSPALHDALVTVHPLGGCAMADTADAGVVDHDGRVFDSDARTGVHEGLYVADGAVVPRPLGVNPSLTITALAERSVAHLAAQRGWVPDEGPRRVPEPGPAEPVGLRFSEVLRGWLDRPAADDPVELTAACAVAEARARRRGAEPVMLDATIESEDLTRLIERPDAPASLSGSLRCPLLADTDLLVTDGRFVLFTTSHERVDTVEMRYTAQLVGPDGRRWTLAGCKVLHHGQPTAAWAETTTLYTTITDGGSPDGGSPDGGDPDAGDPDAPGPEGGRVVARGVLRVAAADFIRQLSTMHVLRGAGRLEAMALLGRFGTRFAGQLWTTYGGVLSEPSVLGTNVAARTRRTLRAPLPVLHTATADDGVELLLTRYEGGRRGPVLLAPGFGVTASSYAADTVDTNFVEALCAAGYDTWLFDYRASPRLASAGGRFSIDDVALLDWPAGVDHVRSVTGAPDVQAVGHCVGSMSLLMALMAGVEGVRSAVCSQLTTHLHTTVENRFKAGIHLADGLGLVGVHTLDADAHRRWGDVVVDDLLRLNPRPAGEECDLPTCRRIYGLFGPSYAHAQLNPATHDALAEWFGITSVEAFRQLSRIVRAGHIVDRHGADTYLPHLGRLTLPILLLAGADNLLFAPAGSAATLAALRRANPDGPYTREVVAGYAHLDCFIGRDAARDVFPRLISFLDRTA